MVRSMICEDSAASVSTLKFVSLDCVWAVYELCTAAVEFHCYLMLFPRIRPLFSVPGGLTISVALPVSIGIVGFGVPMVVIVYITHEGIPGSVELTCCKSVRTRRAFMIVEAHETTGIATTV